MTELAADWKVKSEGDWGGCICLGLDEFLIDEVRRIELREIIKVVTERQIVDGPLHKTSAFLLSLLDGQVEWTAASPLDYMVEGDTAYLKKS